MTNFTFAHRSVNPEINELDSTFGDGCCQGGLAVINMSNCTNVYMGFVSAVCLLSLGSKGPPTQRHSILQEKDKPSKYRGRKHVGYPVEFTQWPYSPI